MKISYFKKSLFALSLTPTIFATVISCSNTSTTTQEIKVAQFNASLATDNDDQESLERWVKYFSYTHDDQEEKITKWKKFDGKVSGNDFTKEEKDLAERLMQIRNIAAIIQKNRPDVLLINEFNNDGKGSEETMKLFQDNYLKYGQSLNGANGGDLLEPIEYPFYESYATNTGLNSGMDLNNNGSTTDPEDAFGFGYYHGHYAFGLMSKYEIDKKNTRTFQNFLWKDMKEEDGKTPVSVPKVVRNTDGQGNQLPNDLKVGDDWFNEDEWNQLRLSSKNHVDVPIIVNGKPIHLLLSHPTPAAFDTFSDANIIRNKYEIMFWKHYIENQDWIYDDSGKTGGIDGSKEKFIIMGDLNADNFESKNNPATREGIKKLTSSNLVNQDFVSGKHVPTSIGGKEEPNNNEHVKPEARTLLFGLRVDWVLPSSSIEIKNSGVYWAGQNEPGRLLFNDPRIGQYGNSKEISSDHRFVWTTIKV